MSKEEITLGETPAASAATPTRVAPATKKKPSKAAAKPEAAAAAAPAAKKAPARTARKAASAASADAPAASAAPATPDTPAAAELVAPAVPAATPAAADSAASASADKAAPRIATAKPGRHKKPGAKKARLVRDSFTFPESEYALFASLKQRALAAGGEIKKSELVRAGLAMLDKLGDAELLKVLAKVERIKTGRPKK